MADEFSSIIPPTSRSTRPSSPGGPNGRLTGPQYRGSRSTGASRPSRRYDGYHEGGRRARLVRAEDPEARQIRHASLDGLDRLVAGSVEAADDNQQLEAQAEHQRRHPVAVLRQLRKREAVRWRWQPTRPRPGMPCTEYSESSSPEGSAPIEDLPLEDLHSRALVSGWLRAAGSDGLPDEETLRRRDRLADPAGAVRAAGRRPLPGSRGGAGPAPAYAGCWPRDRPAWRGALRPPHRRRWSRW